MTASDVSKRMSRQARRDTVPELRLRRRLHADGLRYRVDAPLPGMPRRRADILFPRARVAVFVDGCFWHACTEHGSLPKTNTEWWRTKLAQNVARDRQTDEHLEALGWTVVRIRECTDLDAATAEVERTVRPSTDPQAPVGESSLRPRSARS
ncbi:very short patch repair endonuclease [Calidifontibacter indicus]|uniref:very short patch repair endonuclease n=1 Tax=Calidifontibacter indicus TaxID=419650 RepID=UPI000E24AD9E|nr:very short patch repair endonuclease [Calidifontibacter indicus]